MPEAPTGARPGTGGEGFAERGRYKYMQAGQKTLGGGR